MGKEQRRSGHTVSWLTAHIVWVTKYRYHVLIGDVQVRCRDLVKQICDSSGCPYPYGSDKQGPCVHTYRVSALPKVERQMILPIYNYWVGLVTWIKKIRSDKQVINISNTIRKAPRTTNKQLPALTCFCYSTTGYLS